MEPRVRLLLRFDFCGGNRARRGASLFLAFTTGLPDRATLVPWHRATGLGVCASCLRCLLALTSPFYEHRPYRTATAETRVLEDKTLIDAMVEIDRMLRPFTSSTSSVGIAPKQGQLTRHQNIA